MTPQPMFRPLKFPKCINPRCGEDLPIFSSMPICPTCLWISKGALAAGMFIGGIIVAVAQYVGVLR